MSYFGLEQTFHNALSAIKTKQDCLLIFIHWKLISNGFLCLPNSEANEETVSSELLPQGWSDNSDVYELHYLKAGKVYLMKAVNLEKQLIITVVRIADETVSNLTLEHDSWIGSNIQTFREAYKDMGVLNSTVEKDLIKPLYKNKGCATKQADPTSFEDFSQNRGSPPSSSSRVRQTEDAFRDPLAVGRGDLDPLGRGLGGGMLMDPFRGHRHQPGIPGNLPPGAVPPGARFDPFGPVGPDPMMPPWRAGGFGTPRPPPRGGGFGDPDSDHLPPPGSHDMFM